MGTSTNFRSRILFGAICTLLTIGAVSASSYNLPIDSCSAEIIVEYDSTSNSALLTVQHSGTPNSTIYWSDIDSSSTNQITATTSGQYCVTVITETQCQITKCVGVDLSTSTNCYSYIIKEPLAEGGYMLIVETNDPHPNTSYTWNNNSTDNSIIVQESGEYCVDVYSSYGCPSHACINIEIQDQNDNCPVTVFSFPDTLTGGAYVGVDPSGIAPFSYLWNDGSTTNNLTASISGEFCVTVTDSEGCVGYGCHYVEIATTEHTLDFTVPENLTLEADVQCYTNVETSYTGEVTNIEASCAGDLSISHSDMITDDFCSGTFEVIRTWVVTDQCGNSVSKRQIIIVQDNTAPDIQGPESITLMMDANCWADTSVAVTGMATAYDNCHDNVVIAYYDEVIPAPSNGTCGGDQEIKRTWIATDNCGNQSTYTQFIILEEPASQDSCTFNPILHSYSDPTNGGTYLSVDPEGIAPFTIHWGNGIAGESFHVAESGEYCVEIIDANGCIGTDCIYVEVAPEPIDSCHVWIERLPQDDGTLKLWAHAEGEGDLVYTWNDNAAGTAASGESYFYPTESGQYCVTIYDSNQCTSTACIEVDIPNPTDSCFIDVQVFIYDVATSTNETKIGVDPAGAAPFTIEWSNGSDDFDTYVSESGSYCVQVTDANGCVGSGCIYVEVAPQPIDSCHVWIERLPQDDGTLKLWAHAEGAGDLVYTWNDNAAGTAASGEPYFYPTESGQYCVTIYDANQCTSTACIEVDIPNPTDSCFIDVQVFIYDVATSTNETKIGVDPAGAAPFTIEWSNGSDDFDTYVSESGSYCVQVTDANGCVGSGCIDVEIAPEPVDPCHVWIERLPQDDGTLKLWAHAEGAGDLVYTWNDNAAGTTASGESYFYPTESGQYCVTIYDANQCTSTACIEVDIPNPTDSCFMDVQVFIYDVATSTNETKIGVDPAGAAPFTIEWSNGSDDFDTYVSESGSYCVQVTDANGCIGSGCIYIEVAPQPVDSCHVWIERLPQDDGTLKLWAHAEGAGDLVYTWNDNAAGTAASGEPYFYPTESGQYCVTIYDANQCTSTACIEVDIPNPTDSCFMDVQVFIYDVATSTNETKIGVDPAGAAPFTIEWSNGSDDFDTFVSESGSYCVQVTDANGCIGSGCIYIEVAPQPVDSCHVWIERLPQDDDTLKLWAHAEGAGDLVYTWNDNAAGTAASGEPYFYPTESGQYCVTIYDANQCTSTACIQVDITTVDPVCESWIVKYPDGDNRYKLAIESSAEGPLTIIWHDSTYQDGDYLYIEESGYYCATVIDNNQCVSNACIDILIDSSNPDDCGLELNSTLFANDFVAEVVASPTGTGPFEFMWSNGTSGNAVEIHESQEICLTVTDANGCESKKCISVEIPERPCSLEIIRAESASGAIVLEAIAEGEGDIEYKWSTGETKAYLTISETDEYCVTITASNGCTKTKCIYLDIDQIVCSTTIELGDNSTDYEAVLEANPAGEGPFTFVWDDGSVSPILIATESGTYCVKVIDARGCISEFCKTIEIAIPECKSYIYKAETTDESVTIGVETDGHGPFSYYWSNGENSERIQISESKEYCVEVIDALGCISFDCMYVEVANYNDCSVEIEVLSNADSTEYKIIANPSGTAPFTYKWDHGDTSRYFYPSLDGNFCVTVIDADGCESRTCLQTEGITPSIELEAFPNPAVGEFFIEIDSELEFQGKVEIRDIEGNLLFTKIINIEEGIQGLNFNSDEYPVGIFFVNIIRGSHIETIKVMKASN